MRSTNRLLKANDGTKVPCPMCREPIEPVAKLCKHCKSDLTWRRYLQFSNTTLALLTALIAVVAAVGPGIKTLLLPGARVTVSLVGQADPANDAQVAVLVSNGGTSAVAVREVQVVMSWDEKHPPLPGYAAFETLVVTLIPVAPTTVQAGKEEPIKLEFTYSSLATTSNVKEVPPPSPDDATFNISSPCRFQAFLIGPAGREVETPEAKVECGHIVPLLRVGLRRGVLFHLLGY